MQRTAAAAVGVRAADGKLMWTYRPVANGTANIATPIFFDNKVFYTSGYGKGGALLALTAQNGSIDAKEIYFTREMQNHHGGVLLVKGHLYRFHNAILTCLEFATGKMMWRDWNGGERPAPISRGETLNNRRRQTVPPAPVRTPRVQTKEEF